MRFDNIQMNGIFANKTPFSIAAASTTDLATADSNLVTITGTTTITAFGTVQSGAVFALTFAGALTLTYNATSLILPTAANIVTAAGDVMVVQSLGSGNWKCVAYTRADGTTLMPLVVSGSITAANDASYVNVATATYTDPTPSEGQGFSVLVRNGTATVGATAYATAGTIVYRIYHSGAWANYTPENVANKNASGGYVGLNGFKIQFKNAADTFISLLSNVNTAVREYVFPDSAGTVIIGIWDLTLRAIGIGNGGIGNTGTDVNALGDNAAFNNGGDNVNALGISAASGNAGDNVNALGNNAASGNAGDNVNALGSSAAFNNTGDNVIALGDSAAAGNSGDNVIILGTFTSLASNPYSNVVIISNSELPSFADYATAYAAYSLASPSGFTYLFHDQTDNTIKGVRF